MDDYYITGAVASAANVTYAQLGSLYTIPEQLAHTRFMSQKSFYTIMFGHFVRREEFCSISIARLLLAEFHEQYA